MNWAKLLVLVLSGCLMVERHGVMGQCMADETLSFSVLGCSRGVGPDIVCIPPADTVTGRFEFGIGTNMCMVAEAAVGMTGVTVEGLEAEMSCMVLALTCIEVTTTTAATTTTTAAVDSPESAESGVGGASSRRR